MSKILKERWQKLAGVIKEDHAEDEDHDLYVDDDDLYSDEDDVRDFTPGAAAFGHSGEYGDYFNNERESGSIPGDMTVDELLDSGLSEEEIVDLLSKKMQESKNRKKASLAEKCDDKEINEVGFSDELYQYVGDEDEWLSLDDDEFENEDDIELDDKEEEKV